MMLTCWYSTIHPLRIGALIGTRGAIDLDRFNRFGFFLGATFQIHDDLDNLTADSGEYGKDLGGDILLVAQIEPGLARSVPQIEPSAGLTITA